MSHEALNHRNYLHQKQAIEAYQTLHRPHANLAAFDYGPVDTDAYYGGVFVGEVKYRSACILVVHFVHRDERQEETVFVRKDGVWTDAFLKVPVRRVDLLAALCPPEPCSMNGDLAGCYARH